MGSCGMADGGRGGDGGKQAVRMSLDVDDEMMGGGCGGGSGEA